MPDLFINFAFAQLVSACSSTDTVLSVDDVSSLPTNSALAAADMYLTLDSALTHPNTFEIVKLTGVDTTAKTLTVVRGQDGTSAAAHASGVYLKGALTAGMLTRLAAASGDASALHYKGAWVSGTPYAVNDVVTHSGLTYVCTTPVSSATPSYVGSSGAASTTSSPTGANLALPAGAQSGDVIVVAITAISGATAPTGYTTDIDNATQSGSSIYLTVAHKTLSSADITAGSVAIPTESGRWAATCQVFRNVTAGSSPLSASSSTAPTQSPASDGYVVYAFCDMINATDAPSVTGTSGLTYAYDATLYYMINVSSYESVTGGTTSTARTVSIPGSLARQSAASILLNKPSGGFPSANFAEI